MLITKHAYKRAKQRCGLKKCSLDRVYGSIYAKGLHRKNANGNLRKYLDYLWYKYDKAYTVLVYDKYCFITLNSMLITVWDIPSYLKKSAKSQQVKLDSLTERKKEVYDDFIERLTYGD